MQSALKALAADDRLKVLQISPVYENCAVGMGRPMISLTRWSGSKPQWRHLHCWTTVSSGIATRASGVARGIPRSIDLDIIAYGDEIIEQERLKVSHPRS